MTEWRVHGVQALYESDVVRVELADIELPDGRRLDHHVVRIPFAIAAVVVRDPERGVLMLRRHRFIVDRTLWDVPAGKVLPGDTAEEAATRASVGETGWRPFGVRLLGTYHPSPGISDQLFAVCVASGAEQVGDPDRNECDRVDWVPVERVFELDLDGISLTALNWALR
jgi:8-oxo-dGTP pyrophosphatase MutT (NUDIX family)